jgi:hypothetical protein
MAIRGTLTHWKTQTLAARLGIDLPHALGIMEAVWELTARCFPSGDIGRLPNKGIAMQIFSSIDGDVLVAAMVEAGLLDEHPVHRLLVHDWQQWADYNTKRKLLRNRMPIYTLQGAVVPILKGKAENPVHDDASSTRYDGPIPENQRTREPENLESKPTPSATSSRESGGLIAMMAAAEEEPEDPVAEPAEPEPPPSRVEVQAQDDAVAGEEFHLDAVLPQPRRRVRASPADTPLLRRAVPAIYGAYSRHVGKADAETAIGNALLRLMRGEADREPMSERDACVWLYQATVAFASSPAGQRGQFTPHPATWFNQSRYLDDRLEWEAHDEPASRPGVSARPYLAKGDAVVANALSAVAAINQRLGVAGAPTEPEPGGGGTGGGGNRAIGRGDGGTLGSPGRAVRTDGPAPAGTGNRPKAALAGGA